MEKFNDENTNTSIKKNINEKEEKKSDNKSTDNKEKIVTILKSKIYLLSFLVSFTT